MKIVDERTKKTIGLMLAGETFMYEELLYMRANEAGRALRLEDGLNSAFPAAAELEPVNTKITIHD